MLDFSSDITDIKGVGDKTKKLFGAQDIFNVGALIYNFPRTYRVYPDITDDPVGNVGTKIAVKMPLRGGISVKKAGRTTISLGQGVFNDIFIELIWFNMPYLKSQIKTNTEYVFYGECIRQGKGNYQLRQPLVMTPDKYETLRESYEPVYHLTRGLKNSTVKKSVLTAINEIGALDEFLPEDLINKNNLCGYYDALRLIHFPEKPSDLEYARKRLVYDEFLKFFITIKMEKADTLLSKNGFDFKESLMFCQTINKLPFSLTTGQKDALDEIIESFNGDYVTQRLVQGDVGSGKTILAFLVMLYAVENGYQAAIMAPTEVLARQHENTFKEYVKTFDLPYNVVCVTGSTKASERKKLNEQIKKESGLFIVGTHALVTDKMEYNNLAVVVTDEQHRFGVKQRKKLAEKGNNPHVLVMSATPIPRTLAMILYNDMTVSIIKDVPAKRLPVKNSVIRPNKRKAAWKFIEEQLDEGRQAYIICALVDDSEKSESENVSDYGKMLKEYFKDRYTVGIVHGKMKAKEKDDVMNSFANNEINILVATTVIEVGINVPNASVMLIENADRFGLAQLHQLRGRIGRGEWQSYCMFVDSSKDGKESKRLLILKESTDGFYIAEEDLKLRGPGEFYGVRQSGDMNFRLADIYTDSSIMKIAAHDAEAILSRDGNLESEQYAKLVSHLRNLDEVVYTNL